MEEVDEALDILCCPNCQKSLIKKGDFLSCNTCKVNFLIKNNIYVLLEK